jgi:peptidoglycan/xylan/chitin deacetylase (PgdA/CDA1 family)
MIAAGVAAIFMFHHVAAQPAGGTYGRALTISPAEFESQLRYLQGHGCAAVTVDRLIADVAGRSAAPCEVALTFDDGYSDASTDAAPLLAKYGDQGTFFITTGYIGSPGHLGRAQVRALELRGMELGAHTVTHADLTRIGAASAKREIFESRAQLRTISGASVTAFAYPAGRYDARVETIVRDAGFTDALSTDAGPIDRTVLARDMFALPRYRVLRGSGLALMRDVLGRVSAPAQSETELAHVARSRIEGNAPEVAERVAVAVLRGRFAEPVLKVRVRAAPGAVVAGIMLSGVKFHGPVSRRSFADDVAAMLERCFVADPSVSEVDVWAVVPLSTATGAVVSGDYAVPTNRTVFSASVLRTEWERSPDSLGDAYWDPTWLHLGAR